MCVSELGRLLQCGEYKRCLEEATALLAAGAHDSEEVARIQAAICRSRLELTDFFGAVAAGQEAVVFAAEAQNYDVIGAALVDLATALVAVRLYDQAVDLFERYLDGLPTYTASRCMEGIALYRMADALHRTGRHRAALECYSRARLWFERFGDEESSRESARAMMRLFLDAGEPEQALPLLLEGDQYAARCPGDREFLGAHLLDRAMYFLAVGRYEESKQEAFRALEAVGDWLVQQARANLLLCHNALALNQPREALAFALAARVSAIDGRLYDLEFEASDVLFRLLRERGTWLLREVEADYREHGVNIYHYLSDQVINRLSSN